MTNLFFFTKKRAHFPNGQHTALSFALCFSLERNLHQPVQHNLLSPVVLVLQENSLALQRVGAISRWSS